MGDRSYLQTKLESLVNTIQSPEDLEENSFVQLGWKRGANRIYDEDGDGVEDNRYDSHEELDNFYIPAVFGTAESIYNTIHGELPGHISMEFDLTQSEPKDHAYDLVKGHWNKL